MSDVVNVLVAVAVIAVVLRWATSGGDNPGARALGFTPKRVSDGMVDTVSSMFPDLPRDNIRFDLLRTGSVERTTNKILERGFLDAPPAGYYTLYPRTAAATAAPGAPAARASSSAVKAAAPSLIDRYRLNERVADETPIAPAKPAWADSPAQREASLKERKAQMVLAARQRLLAQQQAAKEGA